MQSNKSISMLTLGIILSSIWLGYSIQKSNNIQEENFTIDNNVFTISQVADYLKMTEDEVQGIINIEKNELKKAGSFTGNMFPYFIVNEKQYFYKGEVDEWLKEISNEHREYDINKRQVIN